MGLIWDISYQLFETIHFMGVLKLNAHMCRNQKRPHSIIFFLQTKLSVEPEFGLQVFCHSESVELCQTKHGAGCLFLCSYSCITAKKFIIIYYLCVATVTAVPCGLMWQGSWDFAWCWNHNKGQLIMQPVGKVWTWKLKFEHIQNGSIRWLHSLSQFGSVILPIGAWQTPLTHSVTLWILNS